MVDLQSGFAEAQRALQARDLERAASLLRELILSWPDQPALYHSLAVALKKQGDLAGARSALERGLGIQTGIPGLHAEHASVLDDLGEPEAAVKAYDRALQLAPDLLDARIDRALVIHKQIDASQGYDELQAVARDVPNHPRILLNLAVMQRKLGRLEESQRTTELLVAQDPENAKAHKLNAQLALDRGRPAVRLFERARNADPSDKRALSGHAAALVAEGDRERAEKIIDERLKSEPEWHEGHHLLAQMRWQSGKSDIFVESYERALEERPTDTVLWSDMIVAIARGIGHEAAIPLYEKARRAAGEDSYFDNLEANSLCEVGELQRAGALYERLSGIEDSAYRLPLIRYCLKVGAFDRACDYGLELIERGHGPDAWPYVGIAWRMLDDSRWRWLEGDRDLPAVLDLGGLESELSDLAARLRTLHISSVHPFEQSLRGGTQTENVLFTREEPEIRSLVAHTRDAVREYIDGMPPHESDHPVLSMPRGNFRFTGSWSVRLTGSGFHVSHYHNQGWISSALYVALPDTLGDDGNSDDGWLALGEPPAEFELDLPPLRIVRPKPARLVLFPSIMWHGTRPFSAGERLTVAFDVAPGR